MPTHIEILTRYLKEYKYVGFIGEKKQENV